MALINCPGCGKQISDLATVCTYCGYNLKAPESKPETTPAAVEPVSSATAATDEMKVSSKDSYKKLFEGDRKLWWIIGGAILLMAILAIILTSGKKNDSSSDGTSAVRSETAAGQSVQGTLGITAEPQAGSAVNTGDEGQPDSQDTTNAGNYLSNFIRNGIATLTQNVSPAPQAAPEPTSVPVSASVPIPVYGLSAKMSQDEVAAALSAAGLPAETGVASNGAGFWFACKNASLFGINCTGTTVYCMNYSDGTRALMEVEYLFDSGDANWDSLNPSVTIIDAYNTMLNTMMEKAGQPRAIKEANVEVAFWDGNGYCYELMPRSETSFAVCAFLGVSTYEEAEQAVNRVLQGN